MLYAVASLSVLVFMAAFVVLRIVPVARHAMTTSRNVLKSMSDPQLDEARREQLVQQAALSLLGNFVSISVRGAVAALLSFLVIYLADRTGMVASSSVLELLARPSVILATTIVLTAAWWLWIRFRA